MECILDLGFSCKKVFPGFFGVSGQIKGKTGVKKTKTQAASSSTWRQTLVFEGLKPLENYVQTAR